MGIFDNFKKNKAMQKRGIRLYDGGAFVEKLGGGYTALTDNPEIMGACFKIAQLVSSMTIHLMANTAKGDKRVINELSRKLDIEPNKNMTRSAFMTAVVMNLLLYGNGNSVVFPHTKNGLLESLEPIEARRVQFVNIEGREEYEICIDGVNYSPENLLHFTFNPDENYLWHGKGFKVALKTIAEGLAQANITKKAFLSSKWKPSIIVKVDGLTDEFASVEGRKKLLNSYISSGNNGEPWLIPSEQFSVEQVRPLSLADLAISDTITLDKKTVAAVLGVPLYLLGVGDFDADEWNNFINSTIYPIAQSIEQEMTRKLILSPKMYVRFNVSKLYAYDIEKMKNVYTDLYDKGICTGNEVREKIGLEPLDGLDNLIVLENYIPVEKIGEQKKLN